MSGVRRTVLAATVAATATLGLSTGQAAATPSVDTIVNGILSVTPLCQGTIDELIIACTELENLTPRFPVMLDMNPIGTHLVVLGAGLTEDGKIRPVLAQRLEAALRAAERYPESPVVVTGGVPRNGITEAGAMKEWLVSRGVPPERIIEESESTSTVENARFTNDVLLERRATGAVLVTNRDHLERAMINFRQAVDARIPVAGIVAA
ncbi:YdcF family protein [Rhodococcus sp. HNM0563]|uniref:YdcF family protein n=1 Tax=unclassified Rhodococcus (in: high G+C Gram-positive bacteria) TaxID=192944 RepID=UPI00146AC5B1|nr:MULTISPECIES: YdcF family protein [unclassified Rhodococcus (in: high G+C Gram-positive bacteria)]NLU62775.1 YdcF family protein [Rhodococcus sp. HNM0563]